MLKEVETYRTKLGDLGIRSKLCLRDCRRKSLDWRPIQGEGELATNSLAFIAVHLSGS